MATVKFTVGIPVANPFKFTLDGANKDQRANFDQQSFSEAVHASTQENTFCQPVEKTDPIRLQFYNNFPTVKLEILKILNNKVTVVSNLTPSVIVTYRNKKYRSACMFSSIDDKLFIYFENGPEYLDDAFTLQGPVVNLEGRLPAVKIKVGDNIRYSLNGVDFSFTEVDEIAWSPALQAQGFLTNISTTLLTPLSGLVEITYHEKPTNLYAQVIDLTFRDEGCYKFKLSFGLNTSSWTASFTSEPFDLADRHERSLALNYRHNGDYSNKELWKYQYLSDWTNRIRLPSEFYKFEPAGEIETYINDSGKPDATRAMPFRQMVFSAFNIPSWLVDKLNVIFSHDTKEINGYHWENENFGAKDDIEKTDLSVFNIQLRQTEDRTIFENEIHLDITAAFVPNSFSNIAFGGAIVTATFNSNTDSIFSFSNLPAWITTDVSQFSNGQVVEFTIAANAVAFERMVDLIADTPDFDDLTASILFHQLYDTTIPPPAEFITVSDATVELDHLAASTMYISVSSSGDYTIEISGPHLFQASKLHGFITLQISEATANNTGVNRTGTIRLVLISNPAIFVDVAVTQIFVADKMISTDPTGFIIGELPTSVELDVFTVAGTQWQASCPESWVSFDGTLKVGSVLGFSIFASKKPVYITERNALITFFNVANPADYLAVNVRQIDGE